MRVEAVVRVAAAVAVVVGRGRTMAVAALREEVCKLPEGLKRVAELNRRLWTVGEGRRFVVVRMAV